ncbi:hypothetical protein IE53DRAFT_408591 [Violaceomyces palustris]|uniref:Uncharacterized protein n=1 Tax=Violaceomyces palustris TaxID=1673888 RepID=A0ACD0P685_9BASI|nr:hypothetical protein IE53DRAFT_408591 [Violaceomyces palustris]
MAPASTFPNNPANMQDQAFDQQIENPSTTHRIFLADSHGSLKVAQAPFQSLPENYPGPKIYGISIPGFRPHSDHGVQKMAQGRLSDSTWVIALARKNGSIDVVQPVVGEEPEGSSSSTPPQHAQILFTVREPRMKAGIERWVGLSVGKSGVYSCTSSGAFRFTSVDLSKDEPVTGSVAIDLPGPLQQLSFHPVSDPTHFAYGGEEIPLSLWDISIALSPQPARGERDPAADDSAEMSAPETGNAKQRKRKRQAAERAKARELMWGEIWRAKNESGPPSSTRNLISCIFKAFPITGEDEIGDSCSLIHHRPFPLLFLIFYSIRHPSRAFLPLIARHLLHDQLPNDYLSLPQRANISSVAFLSMSNQDTTTESSHSEEETQVPSDTKIAVGTKDGILRIFDPSTGSRKHSSEERIVPEGQGGVKSLLTGLERGELFLADTSGKLYSIDWRVEAIQYHYKDITGAITSMVALPSPPGSRDEQGGKAKGRVEGGGRGPTLLASVSMDKLFRVHDTVQLAQEPTKNSKNGSSSSNRGKTLWTSFLGQGPTVSCIVWDQRVPELLLDVGRRHGSTKAGRGRRQDGELEGEEDDEDDDDKAEREEEERIDREEEEMWSKMGEVGGNGNGKKSKAPKSQGKEEGSETKVTKDQDEVDEETLKEGRTKRSKKP